MSDTFNQGDVIIEFDILEELEFLHIRLGIVIDVFMMHELDLFAWEGKIREVVVVFRDVNMGEVHYTVAVSLESPQTTQIIRLFEHHEIDVILLLE